MISPSHASPCHCTTFRQISRKLSARYDAALAPLGINVAQYALMRKLERGGAVSLTQLARHAALDRSTIGRNIRVLERMGLATLGKGAEDEREALAALTPAGADLLKTALPLWQDCQNQIEAQIGTERLAEIKELLSSL